MKKLSLLTAASAAALPASGAIVYTDLGAGVSSDALGSVFFSLSEQWAGTTIPVDGSQQFRLGFAEGMGPDSTKPTISSVSPNRMASSAGFVTNFAEDDLISSEFNSGSGPIFNGTTIFINHTGNNNANWAAGTRGFIGLRIGESDSYNYAWADVAYTSEQSLHLYGFAYDNSGAAIAAGAIPEPSSALFATLAAGSVALFGRRRTAAASAHV